MTTASQSQNITVTDYSTSLEILRSACFGVDHPFRATRQIFGPTVLDTEFETHFERKKSWTAQFLHQKINEEIVQNIISRSVSEGFQYAKSCNDLIAASVYIPNRVLLLLLGLADINPIEHHQKLRAITQFLETNKKNDDVLQAKEYLRNGPFKDTSYLFEGLEEDKKFNELLLFSYAAGETTFVAMKCLILSWFHHSAEFDAAIENDQTDTFLTKLLIKDPPLGIATRYCKQNVTLGRNSFKKGDLVHIDIVAGNEHCLSGQKKKLDLTFGSGKHRCPGQLLAKGELKAAVKYLTSLNPENYELVGKVSSDRPVNFRDPGRVQLKRKSIVRRHINWDIRSA